MKFARTLIQITFTVTACVNVALASVDLSDYNLIFSDEFNDQTLDSSKWKTQLLWGSFTPINGEEQYYVNTLGIDSAHNYDPFQFTGSSLIITADKVNATHQATEQPAENDAHWAQSPDENYNSNYSAEEQGYLSGVIATYDSFNFTHGYAEARAKLPAGQGLWSAFWLLNSKYVEDNPEIDIVEALGQFENEVYHTAHYADTSNGWNVVSTPTYETEIIDYASEFHTYGVLWEPTKITWFVDGVAVKTIDDSDFLIAKQSMYIIANLAVGGSWPGAPDSTTVFPAEYELDYIRAYQRKPEPIITPEVLASDYQLMFFDEFNGTSLDASKWNTSYLWGPFFPINQEKQYYVDTHGRDENFSVDPFFVNNGTLTITAAAIDASELPEQPESTDPSWQEFPTHQYNPSYQSTPELTPDYTSGLITSYDNFKFVNGYVEARIKIPEGGGLWPAFWLLNGYYVGPQPEIDIMEAQGEAANIIHHSYHYNDTNGNLISSAETSSLPSGLYSDNFHTYGVQWDRGHLTWYIDGVKVRELIGPEVSTQLMYVLLNLAVGGNFVGEIDAQAVPANLEIDYVRAYQRNNKDLVIDTDNEAPTLSIEAPLANSELSDSNQSYAGLVSDIEGTGTQSVELLIRDTVNHVWLQSDGTAYPEGAVAPFLANLAEPQDSVITWSSSSTLPLGNYNLFARAIDNSNNISDWQTTFFSVIGNDTTAPILNITYPTNESPNVSPSPVLAGSAADDAGSGVASVEILIRDTDAHQWLALDGTSIANNNSPLFNAQLSNAAAETSTWSLDSTLSYGNYNLFARVTDIAGNVSDWTTQSFAVIHNDTTPPLVEITYPSAASSTTQASPILTGAASDGEGSGINAVEILIRDTDAHQWLSLSGTPISSANSPTHNAVFSDTSSSDWFIETTLPRGNYNLFTRSKDHAGNISEWQTQLFSVQGDDNVAASIILISPSPENPNLAASPTLNGSATDGEGTGVNTVEILIRDTDAQQWLDVNGNAILNGNSPVLNAVVTDTTFSTTSWSMSTALSFGNYNIFVRANDVAGNVAPWQTQFFTVVSTDNIAPVTSISNPANEGATLSGAPLFSGTVSDDGTSGIMSVEVLVRDTSIHEWVELDGTPYPADNFPVHYAAMSNNTGLSADWSIQSSLPNGSYNVFVRGNDNAGNVSEWQRLYFVIVE